MPATETVISTAPFPATQDVLAMSEDVTENGALLFATVAEAVEVQPFVPVTVTLYVPCRQVAQIFRHRTVRPQIRVRARYRNRDINRAVS